MIQQEEKKTDQAKRGFSETGKDLEKIKKKKFLFPLFTAIMVAILLGWNFNASNDVMLKYAPDT